MVDVERQRTCAFLTGGFVLGLGLASLKRGGRGLSTLQMAELGFAALRVGRMVAYDKVMEPVRAPFCDTVPDPTGAGDTTAPRHATGWKGAFGDLLCCPICAGTWAAGAFTVGMTFFPNVTRVFLDALSATGAAEVMNAGIEYFQWHGQIARERVGDYEQARKEWTGRCPIETEKLAL